jgi:hypothetical protein
VVPWSTLGKGRNALTLGKVPKLEHLALGEQNAKAKAMQKKHIVLC